MSNPLDTKDGSDTMDQLLKKTQDSARSNLLPDELSYLLDAFLSTQSTHHRSKAYLVLSSLCQGVRTSSSVKGKEPDPATETLVKVFGPLIITRLADTDEAILLSGITFLTALFQVDGQTASAILQQDGAFECIMDSVDLTPSVQLCQDVAHLLGQATGHKTCRAIITPQCIRWLQVKSRQSNDAVLAAAASVALIKLSKGAIADDPEGTGMSVNAELTKDEDLAEMMKSIVISGQGQGQSSIVDAVEGLAYLSIDPSIKESLSNDSAFLKELFSLVPRRKATSSGSPSELNSTLLYGILLIVTNICAYRPRLTEEQMQVEKLKRVAKATQGGAQIPEVLSVLDDDEHVKKRVHKLVDNGVLAVFAAAVTGKESQGVRVNVGKAFLSIIEDKANRGKVLQSGGARILSSIIKSALSARPTAPTSKTSNLDVIDLDAVQALAKLAITSSPVQVFGPNVGAMYDAIRPLSLMLQHPSAKLLQKFEAMMALTNISSHSPETASRVARSDGLLNNVELLLLEDNPLVRRAAMELICNLIGGSDEVFERYGGGEYSETVKSKVQVLLALSDIEDLPTRLAASGALATVSTAPSACRALASLQLEKGRVFYVLTQLIDPSAVPVEQRTDDDGELEGDPGLLHRGVVCVRNLFMGVEKLETRKLLSQTAKGSGLVQALANVVKEQGAAKNESVLRPAAETLKILVSDIQ